MGIKEDLGLRDFGSQGSDSEGYHGATDFSPEEPALIGEIKITGWPPEDLAYWKGVLENTGLPEDVFTLVMDAKGGQIVSADCALILEEEFGSQEEALNALEYQGVRNGVSFKNLLKQGWYPFNFGNSDLAYIKKLKAE